MCLVPSDECYLSWPHDDRPFEAILSTMSAPILDIAGLTIGLPRGSTARTPSTACTSPLRPNEIVCLVGESGSGKSVIAHATMGLLPRALRVDGRLDPARGRGARRRAERGSRRCAARGWR